MRETAIDIIGFGAGISICVCGVFLIYMCVTYIIDDIKERFKK